ncbi:MAG: toxin-antitoxin system YwqK family antitoxin [Chloroflexota bacterium]|nr:toxin-antitoxin system YwqK family antitoxin [Lentimicrobium sp.]
MRIIKFKLPLLILTVSLITSVVAQNTNTTDSKGLKQGVWEKKDAKGNLVYQGVFENNKPVGKFTYYDSTGKVKAITTFSENGTKAYTIIFEKGFKVSEGNYINEKKDGVWKYYNNDSIVIAEENYVNGVPNGVWKTFYANGAIYEEMPYVNGIKEGTWMQYFYDGPIKTKATYKNGLLEGLATFYYPNGRVFISGPYIRNLKDGVWMHLNDKGIAEKREIWQAGFLVAEEYYDKEKERMLKEEK